MVRNTYIYPPEPSMRIVSDIIAYTAQHMPRFNSISISGYHLHEAGAPPALELALTLADGKEYVRAALAHGMDVDEFAGRLSFFFGVGMDFYVEIAKLRAARLLWWRIMKDMGAQKPTSLMLRTHCQTSGWSLAAQDPYNNIVRTAIEALSAVFGGTQSLHTNAFDEALALPSDFAARVARNTQLIIQEETHIASVVDPWAGSYMMERLTQDIAGRAREVIAQVESLGGMTRAAESGWAKLQIERYAAEQQARLDAGTDVVVGVNKYPSSENETIEIRTIDNTAVLATQKTRLREVRAARDEAAVRTALRALTDGARSTRRDNLLALTIAAVRLRATVGECADALEQVWGRHRAAADGVVGVYGALWEGDEAWREARASVEEFASHEGRRPRVLIAKLGQDGHDRGARVVASGLADLGFDVDIGPLFQTPEEVARQAIDNDVHAVGVSTLAGAHRRSSRRSSMNFAVRGPRISLSSPVVSFRRQTSKPSAKRGSRPSLGRARRSSTARGLSSRASARRGRERDHVRARRTVTSTRARRGRPRREPSCARQGRHPRRVDAPRRRATGSGPP